jgi:calreticulin
MAGIKAVVLACLMLATVVSAKVYFEEKFDDTYTSRWKPSTWKSEAERGEWVHTAGDWYGDAEADKGIKTSPDARFHVLSAGFSKFSNEGKDLVLQYSVKHTQNLDCGGAYIKLLPASSADQMDKFGGDTPYSIMFGPDQCGFSTKKVHVILTYKGKNYLIKKEIACETDQLTHVYTLIIKPDNTYKVLIDLEEKAAGSLEEDWDIIPPKKIKDKDAKKPEDWDEREEIDDPEDVKPAGWDDIPQTITDPEAKKPEDWDDEDDGEWEAPEIPNPDFKGEWTAKRIKNPAYKGIWEAPDIDNPEYFTDDKLYLFPESAFVGFELWQVKSGSIFDNILVTDDVDYAKQFAEDTWGKSKVAEKEMFDKLEEERKAKEAAETKASLDDDLGADDDDEDDTEEDAEEDDDDDLPFDKKTAAHEEL